MPFYEYRCAACGHELEAMQKMSDPPLTDCPECSRPDLTKLISRVGFRLKGGGWYETDFKSAGQRNLDKGDGKPAGNDGKSDNKPDSKPDSKSDGKAASGPPCGTGACPACT